MIDSRFIELKRQLGEELSNILRYWAEYGVDEQFGGFVGRRNIRNERVSGATKGVVLNARILWTFSAAYNFTQKEEYLVLAHRAYNYLTTKFWDKTYGGLFWELNEDGSLCNGRKQIYAQGFGIYGFSEYYRATGLNEALQFAIETYHLIEKYSFDPVHGGYIEALSQKWEKLDDMRLSPKDANEPKSMNTHLHILEPYTNLLRVYRNEELKAKTEGLVRVFLDKILDSTSNHLNLFFGYDWELRSAIVSYGHDIEAAWLLSEAAREIGNQLLIDEVDRIAVKIVDVVLADGCDRDGSIYNELNLTKKHLDTDKHWWPQAEAMVGLAYAAFITNDSSYFGKLDNVWNFIQQKMLDKEHGEWFWRVDKEGIPNQEEDKTGFWKCPYHNSRAMIEVSQIIDKFQS